AVTLLTRALKAAPGRNELAFMLGQLYGRKGDYKTARQLLEQVTKSASEEELRQHAEIALKQLVAMQEQIETYERNRKSGSARGTSGVGTNTPNTTIVV